MKLTQTLRLTGGLFYFRIPSTLVRKEMLKHKALYELTIREVNKDVR